ncbi:hypothetical protein BU24DRAFT_454847 [Aaosphaeria arxii CBS 175.79]|uniref:Uncharacterized protein n=1 Tax=Aaosphaeria arxii CBS 175.79 TaxID=1450172 RepID=A0A6A5XCI5_9PLEO|nr:uncharacterized protein BU24DRAFT_454847 [Aaosphaeria arxii CBS 175.79]KAF2010484.1 hypothetical protein BU24DRAFT_454847 [Aaosphaeria arxii CBS 175.79]
MKSFAIASLLLSAPAALALPDVVAQALPEGCASYPGYNEDTGIAGPWVLQTVDTENAAINGFSDISVYSIAYNPATDRKPTIRWGFINFPNDNKYAKTPLQCQDGVLHARPATDLTAAGAPTNYQWTPLVIAPYPYAANLMYKIEGEEVKIFEHYIDGVKQPGAFIGGYDNSTTWGFQYQPANQGSSGLDYFSIRLLGPNSADPTTGEALRANETRGFIKILG